jgi:hypothetical protein
LAGCALFAIVFLRLGPAEVLRVAGELGWNFAAVLALWGLHHLLRAAALKACFGEAAAPLASLLRVRIAGESIQFLTSTGPFLAEPVKVWLLRRRGFPAVETYAAILAEYLFYTFLSSAMTATAMTVLLARYPLGPGLRLAAWITLGASLAFLAVAAWAIGRRFHLIGTILRWLQRQGWLGGRRIPDDGLRATENRLLDILRSPAPRLSRIIGLECAAQLCLVAELGVCIAATEYAAGPSRVLLLESAIKYVSFAFFFIPAQVGASEGAYALLAPALGWPAALGFAVALVRRLRSLLTALAGFLLFTLERRAFARVGVGCLALLCSWPAPAQIRESGDIRAFAGLSAKEWAQVERGEPVAKVLAPTAPHEAALVGAVTVKADLDCFLAQFRDIEAFKRAPGVLRVQKIATPPRPEDFARLELDAKDLAALTHCRPGDCAMKLPPGFLEGLRQREGASAAAKQQWFRESLRNYIDNYLAVGDEALVTYQDRTTPVPLRREFREILDAQPGLRQAAPQFHGALARYMGQRPGSPGGFLYWSVENFGLKPVLSVTHVLEHREGALAAIASKQIYANHYFDASFGLTLAWEPRGGPLYLIYLNRSRVDLLSGVFGGLRRRIARGRALEGMRNNLADVTRRLEAACR